MNKGIIRFYKPNIKELIILLLIVLLFFMGILKINNYFFSYMDEILEIFIILLSIPYLLKKKNHFDSLMLLLILILNFIGFLGSSFWKYNYHLFSIFIDFLTYQKFFLVYICTKMILNEKEIYKYYDYMEKLSKNFIVIGLLIYLIMYIKPDILNFAISEKYGFKVFQLGGHPSYTCAVYALITSILLYNKEKNRIWVILSLLLCFFTMRSKAYGFIAFIVFLIFFTYKKLTLKKIFAMILPMFLVTYDDIYFYFIANANASRIRLLKTSIEIAKDHFPLGTGFATFGTPMSTRYFYSLVYDKYGLSNSWGYSREYNGWIGDGGWASIIGQFGFLGLLLVLLIIVYLLIDLDIKSVMKNKKLYLPVVGILGYLLISSTNETFFANDFSLLYAISLAVFFHLCKSNMEMIK